MYNFIIKTNQKLNKKREKYQFLENGNHFFITNNKNKKIQQFQIISRYTRLEVKSYTIVIFKEKLLEIVSWTKYKWRKQLLLAFLIFWNKFQQFKRDRETYSFNEENKITMASYILEI